VSSAAGEEHIRSMRELIQIATPSEHACDEPSIERWQVLEPLHGRWSWMTLFNCCDQLVIEALAADEQDPAEIKRAA
jgi:hypothetical protein